MKSGRRTSLRDIFGGKEICSVDQYSFFKSGTLS
jgi:hypothetical protein